MERPRPTDTAQNPGDVPPVIRTRLIPADALRIDAFLQADTPGNVGVALCGGGSRALSAGMGQLRALASLRAHGRSLLSQVKAISAVSGGAWLATPYTYLHGDVSDEDYLGVMVLPEDLRPKRLPGVNADAALDQLRPGNIGNVPANPDFSPGGWLLQSLEMSKRHGVPDRMLWQTLIGLHVLEPYGLFPSWRESHGEPASLHAFDRATLDRDVLADNPALANLPAWLYADQLDPRRGRRPFLICQGAMLLTVAGEALRRMAEVQMTPFFAGVVGRPEGLDANGQPVGGAVVPPFASTGVVRSREGRTLLIESERPFTLADVVGISSAFFAETIRNSRARLASDRRLRDSIRTRMGDDPEFMPAALKAEVRRVLEEAMSEEAERASDSEAMHALSETDLLVPSYRAVGPGEATGGRERTTYVDGGSLDNTGITSLLAYADIDSIIAFQNTYEPLEAAERGVLDADGVEIANSRIRVSEQIPPLFGYQPYREGIGYRLYAGDPEPSMPERAYHQVFEPSAFSVLLRALWRASGSGTFKAPAIARLRLRVVTNGNLGVRGRGGPGDDNPEPITLVMAYTTRVRAWYDRLHPSVRALHGDFDRPETCDKFPHYPTAHIHLSAERINLLAHLCAWCVAGEPQADVFRSLFE